MSTYGYSVYDEGYFWQGQFYPGTTQNLYGLQKYSQLDVTPFTAEPRDYSTITLKWTQPQGTWYQFRLVGNRYGFPVDQNDGSILLDSATYPGSQYADQNIIGGSYHYYGIYIRVSNVPPFLWQRCAFASCLMPGNDGMGARMFSMLPTYFRELQNGELTQDAAGNVYLQQFLNVIGWGADYLKTQYDVLYDHLNDPLAIPLGDLVNLAGQLGVPFQPEVPASLMRKAVANWTHICQARGTPGGLAENITVLTGYPVDLTSGRNRMLEDDQARPFHPRPPTWSPYTSYALNELVISGTFIYKCIQATTNLGNAPSGTTSANTWWTVQQNVTDATAILANPATVGGVSTWEAIYPSLDAGGAFSSPAGSLVTTIGLPDPVTGLGWNRNAFSVFNKAGSTQDIMLRSVSRVTTDMTGTNTNMVPDQLQAIKDGIPVLRYNPSTNGWLASVRYKTNDLVIFDGLLFEAQRASTGATPPSPYTPLNANQAFESAVTPWTAAGNATLAQSSTQAFQGANSLRVTPDGSTANPGAKSETVAVIPGATYNFPAWTFIPAGWSTTQTSVVWRDAFGATISTTSSAVTSVTAATWTQIVITAAVAPANAATAQLVVSMNGTPSAATVSYWDLLVLGCAQTPEWAVLSHDSRLRVMLSAYAAQALTVGTNQTVQVVPFVEWYDEGGNLITSNGQARVTARVATPGTPGGPPNLTFDAFALGFGTYLNGRSTDTRDQQWNSRLGTWIVSGFNSGSVYPASSATRTMATVTGLATGVWVGVTFGSSPAAGQDEGIIFRSSDTNNYWRAGMAGLYKVTSGTAALIGSYSTACSPGDRLVVQLSGSNITVFRNGAQVLTTTDAFNASATVHGIVVENTGV